MNDDLQAKALEALRAWKRLDEHFAGCRKCGADLRGNVWFCDERDGLVWKANRLRDEVLAAVR